MGDAFGTLGEDDGLIELLWCNGHVVMQSQAPRRPPRPEKPAAAMMPDDDEAAPWFQYPDDEDLFSELFGEMPVAADAGKACEEERGAVTAPRSRLMPAHVAPEKVWLGGAEQTDGEVKASAAEAGEYSMLTNGSSICGSYHVQTPGAVRGRAVPDTATAPLGVKKAGTSSTHVDTTTVALSSTRSRSCATNTEPPSAASHGSGKRNQRDATECESPSEGVEFESAAAVAHEPAQKLTTAKRRRAAKVHNLSERRRRDRINEKMKALQELIPHCNKTDKASILDEAIEYLKSLQHELQMMWMGGEMAPPVMFPAAVHHQYLQRMASMPRMPQFMAPPAAVQSSPVNHMPAVNMADPYARCLAGDLRQPPSPMHYIQGMSSYQLTAAKNRQYNPASPPAIILPPATPPPSAS